MKFFQLFRKPVDRGIVEDVLRSCVDLRDIDDHRCFRTSDLVRNRSTERLIEHGDRLREYYLPCKAEMYLGSGEMTPARLLTVLRQLLRAVDRKLVNVPVYENAKKVSTYSVRPIAYRPSKKFAAVDDNVEFSFQR